MADYNGKDTFQYADVHVLFCTPPMSQEQVDLVKTGAIARYLRRGGARAAEALDAALWEFHKQKYTEEVHNINAHNAHTKHTKGELVM